MTPTTFCLIAAAVFVLLLVSAEIARKTVLRGRQRRFNRDRVILEEVVPFKKRGCRLCGSSGTVRRPISEGGQKMLLPCACASKAFLARHGSATQMLGPFRVWKRGLRPHNVLAVVARGAARGASARAS